MCSSITIFHYHQGPAARALLRHLPPLVFFFPTQGVINEGDTCRLAQPWLPPPVPCSAFINMFWCAPLQFHLFLGPLQENCCFPLCLLTPVWVGSHVGSAKRLSFFVICLDVRDRVAIRQMSDSKLSSLKSQDPLFISVHCVVHRQRASLGQRVTLRIVRVRAISCSDEPVEGGSREAARVVAAVRRVMPSNYPSKVSHFAGG